MVVFCPKCGKENRQFQFCPHCGTQMPEIAWSVGMACPHCGGTELEGDCCAFCGARLLTTTPVDEDAQRDCYDIPYRKFAVAPGLSLELGRDALTIQKKLLFLSDKTVIPYRKIAGAVYTRLPDGNGEIIIHWDAGSLSETSIKLYGEDDCWFFYHVFFVIKSLAPSSAFFTLECPLEISIDQLDDSQRAELERLFLKHSPCRQPATEEFASGCRMSSEESKAYVHTYFDWRQVQIYGQDSRLIARDYHRMIRYRNQKYEEWKRKKAQR